MIYTIHIYTIYTIHIYTIYTIHIYTIYTVYILSRCCPEVAWSLSAGSCDDGVHEPSSKQQFQFQVIPNFNMTSLVNLYLRYIQPIYTQYILYIFAHVVVQRSLGPYQLDLVMMAYLKPLQNSSFSSRSCQTSTQHHLSTYICDIYNPYIPNIYCIYSLTLACDCYISLFQNIQDLDLKFCILLQNPPLLSKT